MLTLGDLGRGRGGGGGGRGGGGRGGGFPRGGGGRHRGFPRRGGRGGGWWGGPWWGGDTYVVGACPDLYDPVLGSDGVVYDNACLANAAGATVVSGQMQGLGADVLPGVPPWMAVLFGVGVLGLGWLAVSGIRSLKKR